MFKLIKYFIETLIFNRFIKKIETVSAWELIIKLRLKRA